MPTYRAGVIGLGRMGSTFDDESPKAVRSSYLNCHGPTYHVAQNIELVAGSDPYQEQADLFAERWGIDHSHIYNDHREMLEKKFLDIVSVCTVRQLKFGQILYKMRC